MSSASWKQASDFLFSPVSVISFYVCLRLVSVAWISYHVEAGSLALSFPYPERPSRVWQQAIFPNHLPCMQICYLAHTHSWPCPLSVARDKK